MTADRSRPAATTLAAAGALLGLSGHFGYSAARSLTLAVRGAQLDLATRRELSLLGLDLGEGAAVLAITGGVVALLTLVVMIAALGVAGRRGWGREAAGFLAFVFAFVAVPISIGGLRSEPPAPGAWEGLVVGLANIAVVALLLAPRTAADVAAAERRRALRRHRRREERRR